MALDQATQQFLALMAQSGGKPISESTPEEARANGPVMSEMSGPGPEVGAVRNTTLSAADGTPFRMRVLSPKTVSKSVIVYYHGGGWVLGDIDNQYDHLARLLVNATDSTVVLVNYRKAPEHPFPAAVDDSWQALQWVGERIDELAGAAVPLIVAGDSAGGNLAAVMTQRSRDRGGPAISYQVLVYPVTDADFETASYVSPDNQLLLSRDGMLWFWDHYTPDVASRALPDASPIKAENFAELAPALVLLAEHDPLHDEGAAYATALDAAGIPVTVRIFEGQMHAFFQMVNVLPGAAAGLGYVAENINAHLSSVSA